MSVTVPNDVYVPPDDLAALEREMSDKPGNWRVFSAHPDTGIYTLMADAGDGKHMISCKIQLDTEPVLDWNNEDEIESHSKRFGDGQVIARVPDHLLYANEAGNIGRAFAEGDMNHVRKILNDSDYRRFRSFRGCL